MNESIKRHGPLLLNERQPFGNVRDIDSMDGQGRPAEHFNRPLGSLSPVGNNGYNHAESMADKNPGAYAYACRGVNDPLTHWTGSPKGAA